MSGDPGPDGITLWTRLADVEGRGTVELEVARDRGFRRVVARKLVPTSGRHGGTAVEGPHRGSAIARGDWYRFVHPRLGEPGGPLPHRAPTRFPAARPVRLLLVPGLHLRLLQRACPPGERRTWTSWSASAITYTPTRSTRPGTKPSAESARIRSAVAETLEQYRAKYALYRSDANLRRMHSRHPLIVIWDDHEVQNAYAAGRRRDGRAGAGAALQPGAPDGRLPGLLREPAYVRGTPRLAAHLSRDALRQDDGPGPARSAPVPRRPAVRRRAGGRPLSRA